MSLLDSTQSHAKTQHAHGRDHFWQRANVRRHVCHGEVREAPARHRLVRLLSKGQGADTLRVQKPLVDAAITVREVEPGKHVARGKTTHNHPNHAHVIRNLVHLQRLRSEVKDRHNIHVPTKAVVSSVRQETKTSRRKSVDYRFARRVRAKGRQPRVAGDIVVSPTLESNTIFISGDGSIIVFAGSGASDCVARSTFVLTGRSEAPPSRTARRSHSTSCAKTARRFLSRMHSSRTSGFLRTQKFLMRFSDIQTDAASESFLHGRT